MLQNAFLLQLRANGLPLLTQWFMQHGVMLHTENIMLDFFNTVRGTPSSQLQQLYALSPDLNLYDFVLSDSLKQEVFPQTPSNVLEMREMLAEFCRGAEEGMSHGVIVNLCGDFKKLLDKMVATSNKY
jgi:hypothetical protein